MPLSSDDKVQKLLDEIKIFNEAQYHILQKLREIVFTIHPQTRERVIYGGIMFTLDQDYGGIFASKKHVSFEFTNGFTMHDPEQLSEGAGKYRRHLKIKSLSDISDKKVEFFVKQVA
jgi:hypothetical protein